MKVKHPALASTLEMVLRPSQFVRADVESAGRGDVVVATASDTSPLACRSLAERGVKVVVLTSTGSTKERAAYETAGAFRYLEMTADASALVEAVAAAAMAESPALP